MLLIQIFSIAISIVMILNTYLSYRKNRIGIYSVLFWWSIWTSLIAVSFLPTEQWYVQRISGVTTFNTALVIVIVVIFGFIYRLSLQIHRVDKKITKLVQDLAIKESKETE